MEREEFQIGLEYVEVRVFRDEDRVVRESQRCNDAVSEAQSVDRPQSSRQEHRFLGWPDPGHPPLPDGGDHLISLGLTEPDPDNGIQFGDRDEWDGAMSVKSRDPFPTRFVQEVR